MLTHFNLGANVQQIQAWNCKGGPPGTESILTAIPLFHAYGMTVCMNYGIAAGYELILLPRFDLKELMETIKTTQPSFFPGVPTMYLAVTNFPHAEDYGVSSIKYCNSGAAPLPLELAQAFEQRFGGKIREGYGLSETSPFSTAIRLSCRPGLDRSGCPARIPTAMSSTSRPARACYSPVRSARFASAGRR